MTDQLFKFVVCKLLYIIARCLVSKVQTSTLNEIYSRDLSEIYLVIKP